MRGGDLRPVKIMCCICHHKTKSNNMLAMMENKWTYCDRLMDEKRGHPGMARKVKSETFINERNRI